MKVKYYLKNVEGLIVPERANPTDAGYDVTATSEPNIIGEKHATGYYQRIDYVEYQTNLYFVPESGVDFLHGNFHTDLRPRSSISSKTNFVLANSIGLIDRGYQNQVLVRFRYVWQPEDFHTMHKKSFTPEDDTVAIGQVTYGIPNFDRMYKKGDKVCQILPVTTHDIQFETVGHLPGDDRGGGFGSTGT